MKITTMSHENHIRQAINWLSKDLSFQKLFWINQRIKTVKVADWVILSIQTVSFYSFHLKTVRSPIENRTFSIWKPYGFHMENVKRRQFETDTEPFNHTLICICQTNIGTYFSSSNESSLLLNSEGFMPYRLWNWILKAPLDIWASLAIASNVHWGCSRIKRTA